MSATTQAVIVYLLVAGCAAYALHKLLPRAVKTRVATAAARRLHGGGWRGRLAHRLDAYAAAGTGGCGGCDNCGTGTANSPSPGTTPEGQPIHWVRKRDS